MTVAGLLLILFGLLLLVLGIKVTSFGLLTTGGIVRTISCIAASFVIVTANH